MGCPHRSPSVLDVPKARPFKFDKMNRAKRRSFREESPLAYALHVAGIIQLDTRSVEDYKARRLEEFHNPPTMLLHYREPKWSIVGLGILFLGMAALMDKFDYSTMGSLALIIVGLAFFGFGLRWKKGVREVGNKPRALAAWQVTGFDKYSTLHPSAALPSEVGDIARETEMRRPGVELEIHSLYEDPFLLARYKNPATGNVERFYVAFWNEEGFIPMS